MGKPAQVGAVEVPVHKSEGEGARLLGAKATGWSHEVVRCAEYVCLV